MNNLQVKLDTTNKLANAQYSNHAKREEIIKEIFDMVYAWGRVGIVVDENAPAYRNTIKELLKI